MHWSDLQHEGFHLYEESFEKDGPVYLELNGCHFQASSSGSPGSSGEGGLPNIEITIPRELAKKMGLL